MDKIVGLLVLFLLAVGPPVRAQETQPIQNEIVDIYTAYSRHLDSQWAGAGWNYSVPSRHYRELNQNSAGNLRMQATLAAAYRFRRDPAATEKVRSALLATLDNKARLVNAVTEKGRTVSTRSFHDMIGLYLAAKLVTEKDGVFTAKEQASITSRVKEVYPWALKGNDDENRALLSAAYGLALFRNPRLAFSREQKALYKKQIMEKIKIGLAAIDKNGVYREGKDKKYSLHYQLVSAAALAWLGEQLPNRAYSAKARQMFQYVRRRYPLGKLGWRGSERPTGIGLQTVLLRALGEKYLGNKNWQAYWRVEKQGRGFIDPKNKDRLVWRDEVDKTLNDDYSFISMAELFYANGN